MRTRLFLMPLAKTAFISSVLWLSACSILPESIPQTRYNLPAATMLSVGAQKPTSLYVAAPSANRLINSNYILVQPDGSEIQIYKGTQWADNAPVLLRDRLIQGLNDANLFQAISADAAINTPWALEGYLSHFEVQYQSDEPVVRLQYDAQLINRQNSSIAYSKRFTITQNANSTEIPMIISAFGLASDTLNLQILEWLAAITTL